MYREAGAAGVLHGVPSGVYAGGPRRVDVSRLPGAVRQRLADALSARAEPIPILHERPAVRSSLFAATWGAVGAVFALTSLIAVGFADPHASWAYQPREVALGYTATTMLLAVSLLTIFRRRGLTSGAALVPGRYLLPLDAVEVHAEDAAGRQLVVITPLGDARDARVRECAGGRELLIVLDGGAEVRFGLRSEREGEHAERRLEQSQALLEELTYEGARERALATDPFFEVRATASWPSVAPSAPPGGRVVRRRRASMHGSLATVGALVFGAGVGWAAFVGRAWACDRALYLRAARLGTTDAVDDYLLRATSHRVDAEALRERTLATARARCASPSRGTGCSSRR